MWELHSATSQISEIEAFLKLTSNHKLNEMGLQII